MSSRTIFFFMPLFCGTFSTIMLILLENVRFGYDDKTILEEVAFSVSEGERIGLIGANGEGKTTLLRLMLGELEPDAGRIVRKSGLKTGLLEQTGGLESDRTVYEEMRAVFAPVTRAMDALREAERALADTQEGSAAFRELSARCDKLERVVAAADGYNLDVKIRTVLNGMGFADKYGQVVSTMSGGEKTRLKLCRLLLEEPEILFLDEPTNHLDVSTLFWLEEYLKNYRGAIFTVSHDRWFLDSIVQKTLELERRKVTAFRGNYSKYKVLKAEKYEHDLREYEKQQEEIAALEDYVARNIVRATTARSAQSRVKKLESMERLEKPLPPPRPPVFAFEAGERSEELVLEAKHLRVEAGGRTLVADACLEVRRGEKIAIVGENGAGKTTLLRALRGAGGAVRRGRWVKTGYYDQENADLDPDETVLGTLWHTHTYLSQTQARGMLARAGLREEDIDKPVRALSGGEHAKLALVLLEAQRANLLLLDEPTNHLDLAARESLEQALSAFDGTLLFVSHDRYFIERTAQKIAEIEDGKLTVFSCTYEEYAARKRADREAAESAEKAQKAQARAAEKSASYRSKAERAQEAQRKQEAKRLEAQIGELEAEAEALGAAMADPAVAADYKKLAEACARLDEVHAALDALYEQYEKVL